MKRWKKIRALVQSARKARWWRHEHSYFYNLDNYRDNQQVQRELLALASTKPAVIGVVEAIGNWLPYIPGYRLLWDRSQDSRRNVGAYVREDLGLRHWRYVDCEETWTRPKNGRTHWARSFLVFTVGEGMQFIVAHQPPKGTDNTWKAQSEQFTAILAVMAPWLKRRSFKNNGKWKQARQWVRPRMLLWDSNRRAGEAGPAPDTFADAARAILTMGYRIDNAVTRHVKIRRSSVRGTVAGIRMRSDHRHVLRIDWKVPSIWLPAKP